MVDQTIEPEIIRRTLTVDGREHTIDVPADISRERVEAYIRSNVAREAATQARKEAGTRRKERELAQSMGGIEIGQKFGIPVAPSQEEMNQAKADFEATGGSFLRPLASSLAIGQADTLAGVANTIPRFFGAGQDALTSVNKLGIGDAYRAGRDEYRNKEAAYREYNPVGSAALDVLGALTPGGAPAQIAKYGAKALNLTGKTLRQSPLKTLLGGAAIGGGEGALYGAGYGNAETPLGIAKDAAQGGVLGAGFSAAAPALIGAGQTAARKIFEPRSTPGSSAGEMFQAAKERMLRRFPNLKLTTAQETGSPAINTLTALTPAQRGLRKDRQTSHRQVQGKLLEDAGAPTNVSSKGLITKPALEASEKALAAQHKLIFLRTTKIHDDAFEAQLRNLAEDYKPLKTQLNDILEKSKKNGDIADFIDERKKSSPHFHIKLF